MNFGMTLLGQTLRMSGAPTFRSEENGQRMSGEKRFMIRSMSDNESSLFHMLAEAVAEGDDLEALARPLLKILSTMTGLESTCLTMVDAQQNVQATLFACNAGEIDLREGFEIPWNESLCQRAMSEGRPFIQDVASHWGDSAMVRETSIATYLSMPVCAANGELFGTLCGVGGTKVALGSAAQRTLSLFTDMIARQVDRERLIRRLQRENRNYASEALLDPLTGIPNRRALLRELPRMLRLAERFGHALHVAMIDLDDFKRINDTHGHDAGDRFLIEAANRLADGVRGSDYVARHGGDEFVVLGGASGTAPEESAERFAETLNELTRGGSGPGQNALAYPGASVGVITVDSSESSAQHILARADQAMYRIKKQRAGGLANDGDALRMRPRSSRSSESADK
jgi:diguanylate cyclase